MGYSGRGYAGRGYAGRGYVGCGYAGCGCAGRGNRDSRRRRAAVLAALLFVALASPEAFALVQRALGGIVRIVAPGGGAPTAAGLAVHGTVFGLATFALMR